MARSRMPSRVRGSGTESSARISARVSQATSASSAFLRGIACTCRQDRATYDLPPGDPRAASLTRAIVFGAPDAVLMDLPQLTEDQPAHRPMVAAHAVPWPGEMAVFRSPSTDGFELLTTFGTRARISTLVSDLYAGPT
jgi:hypothetical protein